MGGVPLEELIEMGMITEEQVQAIIERTKFAGGEIVKLLGTQVPRLYLRHHQLSKWLRLT